MTAMNYKLLNFVKLKEVRLWDVKRYFDATLDKKEGYLELSDVLKPFKVAISHREVRTQNMQIISKINFAGNLFLRDFNEIDTYKGSLFLVPKGTIIFSKINARHGCIYYNDSSPFVVSSEYPVFKIDETKAYGNYLHYALRLDRVKNHLNSKVTGIAKSRLSLSEFLKLPIPIPPLATQEKILNALLSYNSKAQDAEKQANELEKNIEDYLLSELGIEKTKAIEKKEGLQILKYREVIRWSWASIFNTEEEDFKQKFQVKTLGELCSSKTGGTPSKSNKEYWNGQIPWVSPKDMKTQYIINSEDKITELAFKKTPLTLFEPNHILIVVRSGILQRIVPLALNKVPVTINQDMKALRLKDNSLDIQFLFLYLLHFQKEILKTVKTSTTVESIDSEKLFNLKIPIPQKEIQQKIIVHISAEKERIKSLRQQAEELRKQAKETFENEIFA